MKMKFDVVLNVNRMADVYLVINNDDECMYELYMNIEYTIISFAKDCSGAALVEANVTCAMDNLVCGEMLSGLRFTEAVFLCWTMT